MAFEITKFITVIEEIIPEKVTVQIKALIGDESQVGIPVSNITTLTFSLYDKSSESTVNARTDVDIKNTGEGVVDASGNLTLTLLPADGVMLGTSSRETHVVLIKYTYNGGAKAGVHLVEITIENLLKVV